MASKTVGMGVPGSAEALVVVVEVVQRVYYALVRSGGGGVATQLRYSVKDTKAGTNDALSCTTHTATGHYRPNYSGSRFCLKITTLVASESPLSQDRSPGDLPSLLLQPRQVEVSHHQVANVRGPPPQHSRSGAWPVALHF